MKTPHKLVIIFSLLLCAAMFFFQSCTPAKLSAYHCKRCKTVDSISTTVESTHTETIKIDTAYIPLPADSSWYYALIECIQDSNKHFVPVITTSDRTQGNRTRVNVSLNEGKLNVDCSLLKDSIEILNKTVTRSDSLMRSIYQRQVVPCPECPKKTGWGKFIMWTGYLFWILVLLYIVWQIFKLTPWGAAFNIPSVLSRFGK